MTRKQWTDAIERWFAPWLPQDPPARLCRARQAGLPALYVQAPHSLAPLHECRSVAVFVQSLETTMLPAAQANNQMAIVSVADPWKRLTARVLALDVDHLVLTSRMARSVERWN